MKQFIIKITAMLLALLVLFSTFSFIVEKHYCGDILVDVSMFSEADKCGMEAQEIEMAAITKKSCCEDQVDYFEGQEDLLTKSFDDLKLKQQHFLITYAYSYQLQFEDLATQIVPHKKYSPPNLITDIHVVDQVFLI